MAKDHAGGSTPAGMFKIPVEWAEEIAFAINIEQFDFDRIDRIEDRIREVVAEGGSALGYIKAVAEAYMQREREEILCKLLVLITQNRKPGLAADQLACAAGLYLTAETPWTELAKKHGVSKQAFEQGVERFREELQLRKTRTMRDEKARATMRQSNYRGRKKS